MIVHLTEREIAIAASIGCFRRQERFRKGSQDVASYDRDTPWDDDIESAAAEIAVAKVTGRYWGGGSFERRFEGDVGTYEVRWTPRPDGHLLIRPRDHDDRYYWLVTGRTPTLNVVGKALAGAVKRRDEWRRAPDPGRPPCWMVPQRALRPSSPPQDGSSAKPSRPIVQSAGGPST